MIVPLRGVAFTDASDGDLRTDERARAAVSVRLGIPPLWATVRQVHGRRVVEAIGAGDLGEADAIFTRQFGVPVAVFTADCFPVAMGGPNGVGIAHAGWRGAAGGVVGALRDAMELAGVEVRWAAIGPGIGPCCFEVGPEVAARFPGYVRTTTWGTIGVDLRAVIRETVADLDVWESTVCTRCEDGWFSYRRDGTSARMAGVTWLQDDFEK